MRFNRIRTWVLALLVMLAAPGFDRAARAAEWQWMVRAEGVVSHETVDTPRAFLWVPPNCERVCAVVVGQHNMEEEPILEHPVFREACADLGVAQVWITPGIDLFFNYETTGVGEAFDQMMRGLAEVSGYDELADAPVVPIGHSAAASFPFCFGAWAPQRTLAMISVSGQWPFWRGDMIPAFDPARLDGVPSLVTMGEYEWADERMGEGLRQRNEHPAHPLSALSEPAAGHFEASARKIVYLALYLRKACAFRLPRDGSSELHPINPATQGWLVPRWHIDAEPTVLAAPVGEYAGDPAQAFWYFDKEHADVTTALQAQERGKNTQLLGYLQDGGLVPQVNGTHQQVTLAFKPMDDGVTFRLVPTFLDTVPDGRPTRWTGLPAGAAIGHGNDPERITIDRICGPVEKLDDYTFRVAFYRMGMDNPKRTGEIWLAATHPGDTEYQRAVQQAVLRIPYRHTRGVKQNLVFPVIPDQAEGVESVPLEATTDSGLPVGYYVVAGPAEVVGDRLRLTAIPPRAKYPVRVVVDAYQYGRGTEPQVQTAGPVRRVFYIHKPGGDATPHNASQ